MDTPYVAQDTRGRYGSDGIWKFLVDDGRDGATRSPGSPRQPWSDGKIGMIGTSTSAGPSTPWP